jgi:DNA-binding NtrC family response regulator
VREQEPDKEAGVAAGRLPFGDPFAENADLNGHLRQMVDDLVRLGITWKESQAEIEKLFIERTLAACDGNRSRAARKLGMHRNTLNTKIEQYSLNGNHRS